MHILPATPEDILHLLDLVNSAFRGDSLAGAEAPASRLKYCGFYPLLLAYWVKPK